MKKLVSLILALMMVASFATVAFAAEFTFTFALLDADQENEVTEVNEGDLVYLVIETDKTTKYGFEINIDLSAFEVATFEEDGEVYDDFDSGSHVGVFTLNPNGAENTISFTGAKTGTSKAVSNTLGLIAKKAGEYTISFKQLQVDNMPSGATAVADNEVNLVVKGSGPVAPTAEDLGLFTDASQNFKVAEKVMTSNNYSIEKALGFVSGIYANAAVVTYGTEITCEGFTKVLDIPAVNTYDAAENVKGFVAAVTSIRNDNLKKAFSAKAYADVTVGEETVRVYAEDIATAVYAN